ncbi:hypothetical protein V6N13_004981 [Hibiscus sabdariffa]
MFDPGCIAKTAVKTSRTVPPVPNKIWTIITEIKKATVKNHILKTVSDIEERAQPLRSSSISMESKSPMTIHSSEMEVAIKVNKFQAVECSL